MVDYKGAIEGELIFQVDMLEVSEYLQPHCEVITKLRSVFIYNREVPDEVRGRGLGLDLLEAVGSVAEHANADFIL